MYRGVRVCDPVPQNSINSFRKTWPTCIEWSPHRHHAMENMERLCVWACWTRTHAHTSVHRIPNWPLKSVSLLPCSLLVLLHYSSPWWLAWVTISKHTYTLPSQCSRHEEKGCIIAAVNNMFLNKGKLWSIAFRQNCFRQERGSSNQQLDFDELACDRFFRFVGHRRSFIALVNSLTVYLTFCGLKPDLLTVQAEGLFWICSFNNYSIPGLERSYVSDFQR